MSRRLPYQPERKWANTAKLDSKSFTCGYCGREVASETGYYTESGYYGIYICHLCMNPTYIGPDMQVPGVPYGRRIPNLPQDIGSLYDEARQCMAVSSYTAAVLCCRKLLMSVAVEKGANPNLRFVEYVEFLVSNNYVPTNTRTWVDKIRSKGNEAAHEIALMEESDARSILDFAEMLLMLIYDYPNR